MDTNDWPNQNEYLTDIMDHRRNLADFQCMLTLLNSLIMFSVFPNMTKYDGAGRIASNLSVALPASPSSTITRMMELPIR
jgi:hypothetical protein